MEDFGRSTFNIKADYLTIFSCAQGDKWYEAVMEGKNLPADEDIDAFMKEVKIELPEAMK